MRAPLLLSVTFAVALPACVGPQDAVATPQRPTFSSATTTTAEQTFEIEAGVEYDHQDSTAVPLVLKYGLTPALEVFVGDVPYQHEDVSGGSDLRGRGDSTLGMRHRVWEQNEGTLSAAYQVVAQLPTGSKTKGFSDDETHLFGAAIVDGAISSLAWTAFYQYGSLGNPTGSGRQSQHAMAFAVSHPVVDQLGAYAELASIQTSARSENPLFLFSGVTLASSPARVWDLGGRWGLNGDAETFAVTAGLTFNLGRPNLRAQSASALP